MEKVRATMAWEQGRTIMHSTHSLKQQNICNILNVLNLNIFNIYILYFKGIVVGLNINIEVSIKKSFLYISVIARNLNIAKIILHNKI